MTRRLLDPWAVLSVVVLVGGWALIQEIRAKAAAEARTEIAIANHETALAVVDSIRTARARSDQARADSISSLLISRQVAEEEAQIARDARDRARIALSGAQGRLDAALDSLDVSPVVERLVERERAAARSQVAALVRELEAERELRSNAEARALLWETRFNDQGTELEAEMFAHMQSRAVVERLQDQLNPTWLGLPAGFVKAAGLVGVGYVIGDYIGR